jgi:DUF971 family protein
VTRRRADSASSQRTAGQATRVLIATLGALAVLTVTVAPVAATGGATRRPATDRQAGATALWEIAAVTPWVTADGSFQVRFRPSTAVPPGAVLSWTVHQRLPAGPESRRRITDALDGRDLGGNLRAPVLRPVAELGDPAEGITLDVPVRSGRDGSDRTFIPNAGIHPVELQLLDADGNALWEQVVFLNRLPEDPVLDDDGRPARMSVTLVARVDGGPALDLDGQADLDVETRSTLAATERLLAAVADAPVQLALRPNLVTALLASGEPSDQRLLTTLADPDSASAPARLPYVQVDTGGLVAADAVAVLRRQVGLGDLQLTEVTGRGPDPSTWWLDDHLTVEAAQRLRELGVRRLVLASSSLRVPQNSPSGVAARVAAGVAGVDGVTATAIDDELSLRLGASQSDPVVAAHGVLTDLLSTWFTASDNPRRDFPGPAAALLVPAQTEPAALAALAAALGAGGPLSTDASDVPDRPGTVRGRTLTASLAPVATEDQVTAVASLRDTQRRLEAVRSMIGDADPILTSWGLLNEQTLSVVMSPAERAATHRTLAGAVNGVLAAIEAPPARRVVVTSRDATIPLRFRNGLPYEVRVVMRARSPRLEIQGGEERELVLVPGENRIDLPVVVRAPGQAVLRIDLRTPDDRTAIDSVAVPVAASTISGVGAALSVLSLLFLAGWWFRTNRRRRRSAARTASMHPTVAPAAGEDPSTGSLDPPSPQPAAVAGPGPGANHAAADPNGVAEPDGGG